VVYAHLSEDALRGHDPDAPVWVENAGGQLLTAAQIAQWCGRSDTSRVTVKRVIDLHEHLAVDAYEVPAQIAEHVRLRDLCLPPGANARPGAAIWTTSSPTSRWTRADHPVRPTPAISRRCVGSTTG
jgi:hypothetical protein